MNVSPMQLRDGRLQDDIAAILRRTGLPARLLEIEVTESVMADNNQTVMGTLHALKAMGVRIALDDFGTGYSSLSYLRRFSFDKIKIDKSFVQGQSNDQGVRVILESILGMCHNLGLAVVGEGVETQQQLAMLRQNGCTELQGYLLGRADAGRSGRGRSCGNLRAPVASRALGRRPDCSLRRQDAARRNCCDASIGLFGKQSNQLGAGPAHLCHGRRLGPATHEFAAAEREDAAGRPELPVVGGTRGPT